jgi:hypothetical protein
MTVSEANFSENLMEDIMDKDTRIVDEIGRTFKLEMESPPKNNAYSYGRYYWFVKTQTSDIYVNADDVKVTSDGALLFVRDLKGKEHVNLAFASGEWKYFFAASCINGGAVAVDHWDKAAK